MAGRPLRSDTRGSAWVTSTAGDGVGCATWWFPTRLLRRGYLDSGRKMRMPVLMAEEEIVLVRLLDEEVGVSTGIPINQRSSKSTNQRAEQHDA
jgi:hypothetical protein